MLLKSVNLKKYKKKHGRENQFLITAYIGISNIKSATDKPSDLNTSWNPKSIGNAKDEAKLFVQRSSLAYSVSAFEAYISDFILAQVIPLGGNFTEQLIKTFKAQSLSRKIIELCEMFPGLKTKEYFLAIISIYWRNKLLHHSDYKLSGDLKGNLNRYKTDYSNAYRHLDIEEFMLHYDMHKTPTFKETLSMMTNLRNFAFLIDNYFMSQIDIEEYILLNLKRLFENKKVKKFDISSNLDKNSRFWTNLLEVHLGLNINEEVKSLSVWERLVSAKNKQELKRVL